MSWNWAYGRFEQEARLLHRDPAYRPRAPWAILAAGLDRLLPDSFPDHSHPLENWEVVATYFMHAQRMLALPLSDCQLLRVAAWTAALVAEVDRFNGEAMVVPRRNGAA